MEDFIGVIELFAGSYAPQGWALCDGSLLQIAEYEALFTLLGTTYGGDGKTTFALPDLRGRVVSSPRPGLPLAQATKEVRVAPSATATTFVPPSLALNHIICLNGIYPSRP